MGHDILSILYVVELELLKVCVQVLHLCTWEILVCSFLLL